MRIATWNVNGLAARLDFVRHWLSARQPDVVGLQELKTDDDKFPYDVFAADGYGAVVHGQKAWNGVAVLSREPAEVLQKGLPGQQDLGARLITAKIGELSFTTVYCPNGKHAGHPDFALKLAWYDALAEHLAQLHDASAPAVVCGDFNVCPGALDSWNEDQLGGGVFHTEAERDRFQKLLDSGLVDVYRHAFPDRQAFSWWDYRAGAFHRNLGLRIDFLLATPAVVERVRHVEIDRDYRKKKDGLTASDHAPVFADLE
jgi:exodeoxyribonuclease III